MPFPTVSDNCDLSGFTAAMLAIGQTQKLGDIAASAEKASALAGACALDQWNAHQALSSWNDAETKTRQYILSNRPPDLTAQVQSAKAAAMSATQQSEAIHKKNQFIVLAAVCLAVVVLVMLLLLLVGLGAGVRITIGTLLLLGALTALVLNAKGLYTLPAWL